MSNKVHSQVRRRILWIENKKAHNRVSAISRSKNKTDGSPSQMVGCVSYLHPLSQSFDLLVPCVTYCVVARAGVFDHGIVRIQRARFEPDLLATPPPHSSRLLHSKHELHRSSTLVGPLPFSATQHPSCLLTMPRPLRRPRMTPAVLYMALPLLMLTSAILRQLPGS